MEEILSDLIWEMVFALVLIVPVWKICSKAGFSPYLSLFLFVPYLGYSVLALVLAFVRWPILKRHDVR